MDKRRLSKNTCVIVPPPPPRFSLDEWYLNNRVRYRCAEDQNQLADLILAESSRLVDQTEELAILNKNETNHHLEERIKAIEFRKSETQRQRKAVILEIEALSVYKERIMDAMQNIKDEALRICKNCVIFREGRLGIDLTHDDIEKELQKEIEIITGAQGLLRRTLEQAQEQVRRLKTTIYFMDRDLEDKDNALKIDKLNISLNEKSLNLSTYHGHTRLDAASITGDEWASVTNKMFIEASQEINSATQLRSYVDTLLKQIIEDLVNQYNVVNEAFRRRIEETKEAKIKLEVQHYEIVRQVNEMMRNITNLEKAIADKEGFLALAHTRLGFRAQRPGLELCRDIVETKLVDEVTEIHRTVAILQHTLAEAQASLRYLLKIQVQLEEDINIKSNTLKIDEVDCMTLRQSMDYHAY